MTEAAAHEELMASLDELGQKIDALIGQRDDLLAACKALAERFGPASGYLGEQRAELLAVESAIARAEAQR